MTRFYDFTLSGIADAHKGDLSFIVRNTRKVDPNFTDEPLKASKWRNLWFDKNGNTIFGKDIWPTSETAQNAADNQLARIRQELLAGKKVIWASWNRISWSQISHAIPMPVFE